MIRQNSMKNRNFGRKIKWEICKTVKKLMIQNKKNKLLS